MLTLAEIRDWLIKLDVITVAELNNMLVNEVNTLPVKRLFKDGYIVADHFYIGKLDSKKEKSIGLYQLKKDSLPKIALGGLECTKTMETSLSILVHWNRNARETESKSIELYNRLFNMRNFYINKTKVNYIKLLTPEPVDVGTDDSNIYERVIEATFYYERKEEK